MDNFSAYQSKTRTTAVYPHSHTIGAPRALSYLSLGLNGESGEVADFLTRVIRDNGGVVDADIRALLIKELGDVLWYVSETAHHMDTKLYTLTSGIDSIAVYQSTGRGTEQYPHRDFLGSPAALIWLTLNLNATAGAVADQVKKTLRDDDGELSAERRATVLDALKRVIWCLSELSLHLQSSLGEVAGGNIAKLADRRERGTIQGSGDNR